MRQFLRSAVIALTVAGAVAVSVPTPAHAWYRGGFFFGVAPFPVVVGPPVVYAPPPYYAPGYYPPPPVAYTPAPGAIGRACYSGPYVCPLSAPVPVGGACSCPTNGGGRVGGRSG
jgi:hypothetical protein